MTKPDDNAVVRIDLTSEQKQRVKAQTGRDADAIEMTVQEVEARIAPRIGANHNETFLVDNE
jgi:hypothetical protein